jgi:L-lactate dehydrogenase complex protein LldE
LRSKFLNLYLISILKERERMRVALFVPCYIDQLYPDVGMSTYKLLKHFGVDVFFPENQTCCGQPAYNTGYWEETKTLAIKFLNDFKESDYIVAPSGSCVTMVKHLYKDLGFDEKNLKLWKEIAAKIYELTEFLVKVLQVEKIDGIYEATVTYHDSCHLLRELRIKDEPRKLLKSIEGLELREMENSEVCCGFGGTFSVKYAGISTAMVEDKIHWALETKAETLTACDESCLMHMEGYVKKQNYPLEVQHIANILWKAIENKHEKK